jgi:hypothetical protein
MNSPVVTDVFKFLAVRPAQRVTEKETERTVIRDERVVTSAGVRELGLLARAAAERFRDGVDHADDIAHAISSAYVHGDRIRCDAVR